MKNLHNIFWHIILIVSFVLGILAIGDVYGLANLMRIDILHSKWSILIGLIAASALAALVLLVLIRTKSAPLFFGLLDKIVDLPAYFNILGVLLFVLLIVAYPWLVMTSPVRWFLITDPTSGYFVSGWNGLNYQLTEAATGLTKPGGAGGFTNPYLHLWLFWIIGLIATQALRVGRKTLTTERGFVFTFLLQTAIYKTASFLPDISSSPFTLSYSEASRYYYASLLFAKQIYGFALPWSFLHPTRYFMQAVPFAIPNLPIEYHRLWQVLLWLGMTIATSLLLARRLNIKEGWAHWIFVTWVFLYLLQGPVYYHLLVCVIIVLIGFSAEHPWRTLISVLAASIWAGMSRVNWFPVPGMLAGALYFLEVPVGKSRNLFSYFSQPAFWFVAGVASAFSAQALYIPLSGNTDISKFGSSFTSDLLWYRLWPNPTFSLGILPASLLVVFPLLLAMAQFLRGNLRRWNPWRLIGLTGYTLVLFGGGLIVSIKIGGGTLHNMDAFMVMMLLITSSICFGRFAPEAGQVTSQSIHWATIALAMLIPFWFFITTAETLEPHDPKISSEILGVVRTQAQEAAKRGEVLFIQQRQLLTFGYIKNVPLVPDYEIVTLMEMAMSRNSEYMGKFYADINKHRFALIVAAPQFTILKGSDYNFGEENDVWVRSVSVPILCEYEPTLTIPRINIQFLVPRGTPTDCPAFK